MSDTNGLLVIIHDKENRIKQAQVNHEAKHNNIFSAIEKALTDRVLLDGLTIVVSPDYKRFAIGRTCFELRADGAFHELGKTTGYLGTADFIRGEEVEMLC